MSVTAERKQELINEFKTSENDTGSSQVQIAILTERIRNLTEHMREHKHDFHTRRGLLKLVGTRQRLQKYLKGKNLGAYQDLISKLGLRR